MSLALLWEPGPPLAGASSCWDIQMWDLQVWDTLGSSRCGTSLAFGAIVAHVSPLCLALMDSETSAGDLRDARGSGVALCWLETKQQLGHPCWWPGGEQLGWAGLPPWGLLGFALVPSAFWVNPSLHCPIRVLTHVGKLRQQHVLPSSP